MKKICTALCLCWCFTAFGQNNTIIKKKFNWGNEGNDNAGYTQAVRVDNIIYISGTVGGGTIPEQLTKIYQSLQKTLAAYGATFQNVVKENLYTTAIDSVKKYNDIRKTFYKGDWPAATWTEVKRLYEPTAIIEVELIAHLPKQ